MDEAVLVSSASVAVGEGRKIQPVLSSGEGRGTLVSPISIKVVVNSLNRDDIFGVLVLKVGGPVIFPIPPRKTLVVPPDPLLLTL